MVVTDVGQHQMWEAQYYHHDTPRSLITSGGLGTMGFALPAAIGAKIGRPDAEVWVVVGDGGFQMTMCELATMVQEELDVNDRRSSTTATSGWSGSGRSSSTSKRYAATPLIGPDFAKLAQAFGICGGGGHAAQRGGRAVAGRAPQIARALIDFQVEQEDSVFPMVPAGADLHKMILRPSPIVETAASHESQKHENGSEARRDNRFSSFVFRGCRDEGIYASYLCCLR